MPDGVSVERFVYGDESTADIAYGGDVPDEARYQFHTAADADAVIDQFSSLLGAPAATAKEDGRIQLTYDDQEPINGITIGDGHGMTRVAVYADQFSSGVFENIRDETYDAAQRAV